MPDSSSVVLGPKLGQIVYADIGANFANSLRTLLRALDQLIQGSVISRIVATPPGSPANGDAYIVAASPTGAWTGKAGQIAAWSTQVATVDTNTKVPAWDFFVPSRGAIVYSQADSAFYFYDGSAWQPWRKALYSLSVNATSGAAATFDASASDDFELTLTANCTITISNPSTGQKIRVLLHQDATGSRTVTWPATVKGGGAPSATASSTSAQAFEYNGTNWYATGSMITGM